MSEFDITKPRELYKTWVTHWQMFKDFYEFGPDVLYSGDYLHMHPRETIESYSDRVKRCDNYNLIPEIFGVYKSYQFSSPPQRKIEGSYKTLLEDFIANADSKGGSLDDFMQHTAYVDALTYGWNEILVDMPTIVDPVVTVQQQKEAGYMPYVRSITPMERINWSLNTNESYKWTVIAEQPGESDEQTNEPSAIPTYLLLKPQGWERYEKQGEDEHYTLADSGLYTFGRVPLVPLYYTKSRKHRRFGVSLCNEIAPVAKALLNLISQQQEDIFMSFSFLGVQTDQKLEGVNELGTKRVIAYSGDAKNPPGYITVPVEHIEAKQKVIEAKIEQILRKSKLSQAMGELSTKIKSGIAGAVERMELFETLATMAKNLEEAEMQIASMVCSYNAGKYIAPEDTGLTVHYNDKFNLEPTKEMIEFVEKVVSIYKAVSPEYVKHALKILPHRDLRMGDEIRDTIDDEIDGADIAEMDLIPEPEIEDDGDNFKA